MACYNLLRTRSIGCRLSQVIRTSRADCPIFIEKRHKRGHPTHCDYKLGQLICNACLATLAIFSRFAPLCNIANILVGLLVEDFLLGAGHLSFGTELYGFPTSDEKDVHRNPISRTLL